MNINKKFLFASQIFDLFLTSKFPSINAWQHMPKYNFYTYINAVLWVSYHIMQISNLNLKGLPFKPFMVHLIKTNVPVSALLRFQDFHTHEYIHTSM